MSDARTFGPEVARFVGTTGGAAGAMAIAGWPVDATGALVTAGGGFAGLIFVLAAQRVWRAYSDKAALELEIRKLSETIESRDRMIDVMKQQQEDARKELVVSQAWSNVWANAFTEAQNTGTFAPVQVLEKRAEANMVGKL